MELCEAAPPDAPPASAVVSLACLLADAGSPTSYPVVRFEETGLHFRRLPPRIARACLLSHRAYVERALGNCDDARVTLTAALEIAEAGGAELDTARLAAQRGCVEATAGELDAAESWLQRSLDERRRLREHRGILLTLANLAVVAAAQGEPELAEARLAEARRMAEKAVDGPGMGAVSLARAEIARRAADSATARDALEYAIDVFYGLAGFIHQLAWLRAQQAYLSLDLGDLVAAEGQLTAARERFEESQIALGIAYCDAIEKRLRAANAALT
jgi:hypothetical protein